MNDKCLGIGAIQAFLDGETAPELSFAITEHTAKCPKCAQIIAEAEEQNSLVFAMLDREMDVLVPTQRLWSSIAVALAEEKKQVSIWAKLRQGLLTAFASPSIAVAASVVLVFAIFAAVWTLRTPVSPLNGPEVAGVTPTRSANSTSTEEINTTATEPIPSGNGPIQVGTTNLPPSKVAELVRTANYRAENRPVRAEPAMARQPVAVSPVDEYLPGEESYVRTIADLKQTVDGRKDLILDPSSRVAYERNIAVVNDNIKRMKDVVRKNPKNQAAKQVLYSSYQSKIDLLNSVVEREELMASMQ